MPVYGYRCECGKTVDVLVRSGREPQLCDEVNERGFICEAGGGRLSRQLSAPYVGTGTKGGAAEADPCSHCGSTPGSCEYES